MATTVVLRLHGDDDCGDRFDVTVSLPQVVKDGVVHAKYEGMLRKYIRTFMLHVGKAKGDADIVYITDVTRCAKTGRPTLWYANVTDVKDRTKKSACVTVPPPEAPRLHASAFNGFIALPRDGDWVALPAKYETAWAAALARGDSEETHPLRYWDAHVGVLGCVEPVAPHVAVKMLPRALPVKLAKPKQEMLSSLDELLDDFVAATGDDSDGVATPPAAKRLTLCVPDNSAGEDAPVAGMKRRAARAAQESIANIVAIQAGVGVLTPPASKRWTAAASASVGTGSGGMSTAGLSTAGSVASAATVERVREKAEAATIFTTAYKTPFNTAVVKHAPNTVRVALVLDDVRLNTTRALLNAWPAAVIYNVNRDPAVLAGMYATLATSAELAPRLTQIVMWAGQLADFVKVHRGVVFDVIVADFTGTYDGEAGKEALAPRAIISHMFARDKPCALAEGGLIAVTVSMRDRHGRSAADTRALAAVVNTARAGGVILSPHETTIKTTCDTVFATHVGTLSSSAASPSPSVAATPSATIPPPPLTYPTTPPAFAFPTCPTPSPAHAAFALAWLAAMTGAQAPAPASAQATCT